MFYYSQVIKLVLKIGVRAVSWWEFQTEQRRGDPRFHDKKGTSQSG